MLHKMHVRLSTSLFSINSFIFTKLTATISRNRYSSFGIRKLNCLLKFQIMQEISDKDDICGICGIVASKKCSACKQVSYCSKEHQKSDWKKHKKNCKPFTVCNFKLSSHSCNSRFPFMPVNTSLNIPLTLGFNPTIFQCLKNELSYVFAI